MFILLLSSLLVVFIIIIIVIIFMKSKRKRNEINDNDRFKNIFDEEMKIGIYNEISIQNIDNELIEQ